MKMILKMSLKMKYMIMNMKMERVNWMMMKWKEGKGRLRSQEYKHTFRKVQNYRKENIWNSIIQHIKYSIEQIQNGHV